MQTMDLMDLYRSLLEAAGLDVTEDGFVRLLANGEYHYATKGGKSMVIPTLEQLRSPALSERLRFHPLAENTLEPESEELALYRHLLVARTNAIIGTAGMHLLRLASSEAAHPNLSPDQKEFLSLVPDADETVAKAWGKLATSMPATQTAKAFTTIYLKKGGSIAGKSFSRVAVVNFPFYQELQAWKKTQTDKALDKEQGIKARAKSKSEKGQHQIYGVGVREMDCDTLIGMMKYLVHDVDTPEEYYCGSSSNIAPSLDALMHSFMRIAARLNDIVDLFGDVVPELKDLRTNSKWVTTFNDLESMWPQIRNVPNQNQQGTNAPVGAAPNLQHQAVQALAGTPAPVAPASVYQTPPVQQMAPPPQAMPWQSLQQPPAQYYPPQQQPYGQQPPQPQQPPARTGNGISMAALIMTNPAMQQQLWQQQQAQQQQYGAPQYPTWPPQPQQPQGPVQPWHFGNNSGPRY